MELIRRDYTANGGWETFLSYEDPEQGILYAASSAFISWGCATHHVFWDYDDGVEILLQIS